jgi:AhpD family alkylhydroperoxidase
MTQRLDYRKVIPDAMKALDSVRQYVANSGLPHDLIDLMYLRVSQINGCAYCVDLHTRDLLKNGMKIEKIVLVSVYWEAESFFTEKERAALAWAESLTLISETKAPDEVFAKVSKHFSEKELADLTVAIAIMNSFNRIAVGFRRGPAPR